MDEYEEEGREDGDADEPVYNTDLLQPGTCCFLKDDPGKTVWEIEERIGDRVLLTDVGYEVSHIVHNWHHIDECEPDEGQYDDPEWDYD